MKIDVKRYGEDPEELRLALDEGWVAQQLKGVLHAQGQGQGEAVLLVSRLGAKVQVTGNVRARFPVACARCLEPAEVSMDEPFVMVFEKAMDQVLPQELELTEDDMHWETYDGREIDLAPLLREQLLLAVPMTPLCRPDCDGLVGLLPRPPGDGAGSPERLEVDGKPIDPRWNALAKLKPTR